MQKILGTGSFCVVSKPLTARSCGVIIYSQPVDSSTPTSPQWTQRTRAYKTGRLIRGASLAPKIKIAIFHFAYSIAINSSHFPTISKPAFLPTNCPFPLSIHSFILSIVISLPCSSIFLPSLLHKALPAHTLVCLLLNMLPLPYFSLPNSSLLALSPQVFALLIVPNRGKLWSRCPVK